MEYFYDHQLIPKYGTTKEKLFLQQRSERGNTLKV